MTPCGVAVFIYDIGGSGCFFELGHFAEKPYLGVTAQENVVAIFVLYRYKGLLGSAGFLSVD